MKKTIFRKVLAGASACILAITASATGLSGSLFSASASSGHNLISEATTDDYIDWMDVSISYSELVAANYEVTLYASTNFDWVTLAFGAEVSDGLTFVSASFPDGVRAANNGAVWYAGAVASQYRAGQCTSITVKVDSSAQPGDTFTVTGLSVSPAGAESYHRLDSEDHRCVPDVLDGVITIVEDAQKSDCVVTWDNVSVTKEELAASGYTVTVNAYVNKDWTTLAYGARLDERLTFVSATYPNPVSAEKDGTIWYAGASAKSTAAGWCGKVTVRLDENAAVGDVYAIEGLDTSPNGTLAVYTNYSVGDSGGTPTVYGGLITVVDGQSTTTPSTGSDHHLPTDATTEDYVEWLDTAITYSDLVAANYEVTLYSCTNFDWNTLAFGAEVSDGLTIENADFPGSVAAEKDGKVWYAGAYANAYPTGQCSSITVKVDSSAQPGDTFTVTGLSVAPAGSESTHKLTSQSHDCAPDVLDGVITILEDPEIQETDCTVTLDNVTLTESELAAANYEVTLKAYTNMDWTTLSYGLTIGDGLSFVSATCPSLACAEYNGVVWYGNASATAKSAGWCGTITVRVDENATAGDVYTLGGLAKSPTGNPATFTNYSVGDNGGVPTIYDGTITIVEDEALAGDIDGDGILTIQDAYQVIMLYVDQSLGKEGDLTEKQQALADVDGDGNITTTDAYLILLYHSNCAVGNDITWDDILK